MPKSLSNEETAFYENVLANTLGANNSLKRALYWAEEPETIAQIADAMGALARMRRLLIDRRDAARENEKPPIGR